MLEVAPRPLPLASYWFGWHLEIISDMHKSVFVFLFLCDEAYVYPFYVSHFQKTFDAILKLSAMGSYLTFVEEVGHGNPKDT
jgi:hypothetical protein